MFSLPQDIFPFLIGAEPCLQAGEHCFDLSLTDAGKQLCPF